jgi:thiol-disulfide isomerase/thioredoxin
MNRTNKIVFALVAVIAIGAGVQLSKKHAVPPTAAVPAPAGPVAAFYGQSMNDASGAPQALAQWKGKAVLVNFWAPWCGPCVQEMPELVELSRELGPKQVGVVGIGIDSPTNIAQFTEKYKISYPIYVAGMSGTELSRQFGNTNGGLPFTVLIGADGTVRKTYLGRLKFDELRADLAAL